MKVKETFDRAYGNIPKEPLIQISFDVIPFRGIKYYWIRFVRFFTR